MNVDARRSPQGERGLKSCKNCGCIFEAEGRSPQGERGLKYELPGAGRVHGGVAPHKGSVD